MPEIKDTIKTFLTNPFYKRCFRYKRFDESTIENIFKLFKEKYKGSVLDKDMLSDAIKETVKSYNSTKSTALTVFKKYLEFLKKEYNFKLDICFPGIDIASSLERRLYIVKVLQDPDKTVSELSDELWTSERTIEKDLLTLRGMTDEPINMCGRRFIIRESKRRKDKLSFASTVHPLFLTFNLTQVISTLKGLRLMYEEPAFKQYALLSAKAVWQQLSDYAKERIIKVSEELIPDEVDWYKDLDKECGEMFYTERECSSTDGAGVILDCIKNDKICFVEYLIDDRKTVFLSNCKVIRGSFKEGSLKVKCDEEEYTLALSNVLRSAYIKEELI